MPWLYPPPGRRNSHVLYIFTRQRSKLHKSSTLRLHWTMNASSICISLPRHDNPFFSVKYIVQKKLLIHSLKMDDKATMHQLFKYIMLSAQKQQWTIFFPNNKAVIRIKSQNRSKIWMIWFNSKWWSNVFLKQNYGLCLMFNQVKYSSQTTILSDKSLQDTFENI